MRTLFIANDSVGLQFLITFTTKSILNCAIETLTGPFFLSIYQVDICLESLNTLSKGFSLYSASRNRNDVPANVANSVRYMITCVRLYTEMAGSLNKIAE